MSDITISEFRYWLEGVEDMQEENWTPNAVQWTKIRSKIKQLRDTVPVLNPADKTPPNIPTSQSVVPSYQLPPMKSQGEPIHSELGASPAVHHPDGPYKSQFAD